MTDLAATLLSNALLVVPLVLLVVVITRFVRHPGIAWALWGLVLLKFVTPAIIPLPVDAASHATGLSPGSIPDGRTTGTADLPRTRSNREASDRTQPIRDAGAGPSSGAEQPATPVAVSSRSPDILPGDTDLTLIEAPLLPPSDEIATFMPGESGSDAAQTSPADIAPSVISTTTLGSSSTPQLPQVGEYPSRTSDRAAPVPPLASRTPHRASRIPIDWSRLIWCVWAIGTLFMLTLAIWRIIRFRRLLAAAAPADDELVGIASELAGRLGLRRIPAIRLAEGRVPPLLYGDLRQTTILLPRQLLATLDLESRRTLLAHELAHIARRDHWTRWLELLVRCLYWWHPFAWYSGHRLRDAEEQCCDARVVALLPGSAASYARTILTTVDYLAGSTPAVPTLATGLQPLRRSVRPLHRRLTMIVETQPKRRLSWASRLLILALAMCVLPISLLAQSDETSPAVDDPSEIVEETRDRKNDIDTAATHTPAVVIETTDGLQLSADGLRLWPDRVNVLAQGETVGGGVAATGPAEKQQETTITVQRKSYATDGTLGQSVVRLLEQMQRSGLVDPLLAHLNGGNGAAWDGEEWNYQTSVTVITSPPAHKAIGEFIDNLRALRPAPGQSGPEELQIRKVVYDRDAGWDSSRELAGLLGEAVKMGHVSYARITSDQQNRMVITTTDPVHKVLGPFIEFLNEQQTEREAADSSGPVNPLAGAAFSLMAPGAGVLDDGETASGVGAPSELHAIPPTSVDRSLPGGRTDSHFEDSFAASGASAPMPGGRGSAQAPNTTGRMGPFRRPAGSAGSNPYEGEIGSTLAARPPQRPQVLTAPHQAEEMHLVAKVYGLHPAIVQPLGEFLQEVRDGFPFYSGRLVGRGAGRGMSSLGGVMGMEMGYEQSMMSEYAGQGYGNEYSAGGPGGMESGSTPQNVSTRIFAPAEAQKVLGKFVAALHATDREQSKQETPDDAETIVLVRGEYELSPAAAEKFEILLRTCERHGLATPLMVTRNQTRVKVIASKDLQTAIRVFIAYLSENWKTASMSARDTHQPQNYAQMRTKVLNTIFKAERLRETDPQQAVALLSTAIAQLEESDLDEQQLAPLMKSLQDSKDSVEAGIDRHKRTVPDGGAPSSASAQVQHLDVKIAELELERAREAFERAKGLVERGAITEDELKAAELDVLKAQRELERLKMQPDENASD